MNCDTNSGSDFAYEETERVVVFKKQSGEDLTLASQKSKKKKTKARKDSVLLLDLKFANQPTGFSSTTSFVGLDDCNANNTMFSASAMNGGDKKLPQEARNGTDEDDVSVHSSVSISSKSDNKTIAAQQQMEEDTVEADVLLDEIVKLKSQLKLVQKENKTLCEEIQNAKLELNESRSAVKHDSKRVQKENEKLKLEMEALKKDFNAKETENAVVIIERAAFSERLQHFDRENKRLQQIINQSESIVDASEERHRAICAEITVLTLQKNYEVEMKQRALNDVKKIITHLDAVIPKCKRQEALEAKKYQGEFVTIMRKFESDLQSIKKQFDEQIEMVKKGTLLSSLKRIQTPVPLAPPPMLQLKSLLSQEKMTQVALIPNELPGNHSDGAVVNVIGHSTSQSELLPNQVIPSANTWFESKPDISVVVNQSGQRIVAGNGFMVQPANMARTFPNFFQPQPFHFGAQAQHVQPADQLPSYIRAEPLILPRRVETKPPGLHTNFNPNAPIFKLAPKASDSATQIKNPNLTNVENVALTEKKLSEVPNNTSAMYVNTGSSMPPFSREDKSHETTPVKLTSGTPSISSSTPMKSFAPEVVEGKKISKIEQIYEHFANKFSATTQEEIKDAIHEYRQNQPDKKLSGKTMPQLKAGVEVILARKFGNAAAPKTTERPVSVMSNQSSTSGRPVDGWQIPRPAAAPRSSALIPVPVPPQIFKQPETIECCICLDALHLSEPLKLDCGHEAHKDCLNDWIAENKTCPLCRQLALPEGEYPRL